MARRIYGWTSQPTCPTCEQHAIFTAEGWKRPYPVKIGGEVKTGYKKRCECRRCGCQFTHFVDAVLYEFMILDVIVEGDLFMPWSPPHPEV